MRVWCPEQHTRVRSAAYGLQNLHTLKLSTQRAHPLTVEHRKTRYGPSSCFTTGSGMAAASSMISSSACASRSWCCGWMYCTVCATRHRDYTSILY